jgi:hypothetical protein
MPPPALDDLHHPADGLRIFDRGTSELHHH